MRPTSVIGGLGAPRRPAILFFDKYNHARRHYQWARFAVIFQMHTCQILVAGNTSFQTANGRPGFFFDKLVGCMLVQVCHRNHNVHFVISLKQIKHHAKPVTLRQREVTINHRTFPSTRSFHCLSHLVVTSLFVSPCHFTVDQGAAMHGHPWLLAGRACLHPSAVVV